MFERLTEPARRGVACAQEEAADLGHPAVGAEHLLLGLVRNGTPATRALGLDADEVRGQVIGALGAGSPRAGALPLAPSAQAAVERALLVEIEMGDHRIGPEHLLHALAHQPEAVAILEALDCPPHVLLAALSRPA